jgi:hypothetical protein
MFKMVVGVLLLTGALYLGGKGFVANDTKLKELIASNKLSEEEGLAFRACVSDMRGKSYTIKSAKGSVKMSRVPREICVCQSRTMARVFKKDQYGDHDRFMDYVSEGSKTFLGDGDLPKMERANLKSGYDPDSALLALVSSLGKCSDEYKAKHVREQKEARRRVLKNNPNLKLPEIE